MGNADGKAVALFREQFKDAFNYLEGIVADVTTEDAHWKPAGTALPAGAIYGHLVIAIDGIVNGMLKGGPPLYVTSFSGKTGLSEIPPGPDPAKGGFPDWTGWARGVAVDLAALRKYADAVYAAADGYLATLSDADLARPLDLSALGLGQVTFGFMLNNAVLGHTFSHGGEISCLKGLRGKRGSR